MNSPEFIEIEDYIEGKWVSRIYPRLAAVSLMKQLQRGLGELAPSEQFEPVQEAPLKVLVD